MVVADGVGDVVTPCIDARQLEIEFSTFADDLDRPRLDPPVFFMASRISEEEA